MQNNSDGVDEGSGSCEHEMAHELDEAVPLKEGFALSFQNPTPEGVEDSTPPIPLAILPPPLNKCGPETLALLKRWGSFGYFDKPTEALVVASEQPAVASEQPAPSAIVTELEVNDRIERCLPIVDPDKYNLIVGRRSLLRFFTYREVGLIAFRSGEPCSWYVCIRNFAEIHAIVDTAQHSTKTTVIRFACKNIKRKCELAPISVAKEIEKFGLSVMRQPCKCIEVKDLAQIIDDLNDLRVFESIFRQFLESVTWPSPAGSVLPKLVAQSGGSKPIKNIVVKASSIVTPHRASSSGSPSVECESLHPATARTLRCLKRHRADTLPQQLGKQVRTASSRLPFANFNLSSPPVAAVTELDSTRPTPAGFAHQMHLVDPRPFAPEILPLLFESAQQADSVETLDIEQGPQALANSYERPPYCSTRAQCYACVVSGLPCQGRRAGAQRRLCDTCKSLGLTKKQCAVPGLYLDKRHVNFYCKDMPKDTATVSQNLCHICGIFGPGPGRISCSSGMCSTVVCAETTCRQRAMVVKDSPYFLCCHCIGVPFMCGCDAAGDLILNLSRTAPLIWAYVADHYRTSSSRHRIQLVPNLPSPTPLPDRRWLYFAAGRKDWRLEEFQALAFSLFHLRNNMETHQAHQKNILLRWLQSLPYPPFIVIALLWQLDRTGRVVDKADSIYRARLKARGYPLDPDPELLANLGWKGHKRKQEQGGKERRRRRRMMKRRTNDEGEMLREKKRVPLVAVEAAHSHTGGTLRRSARLAARMEKDRCEQNGVPRSHPL